MITDEISKLLKDVFATYKDIFSGTIKETFLIRILNLLFHDQRYSNLLMAKSQAKPVSMSTVLCGQNNSQLNVCKMIVMQHYANTVMLDDYEKGKQQESSLYKNKLVDQILDMIKVEEVATFQYSSYCFEAFFPLIYYVSALCNYCGIELDKINGSGKCANANYNDKFNRTFLYKIIKKIMACIHLLEIQTIDEIAGIFRSLCEMFLVFLALWDEDDKAINSYLYFNEAMFDYNAGSEIPGDIALQAKDFDINPVQFLTYGWIKSLKNFKISSKKALNFKLGHLARIIDIKYADMDKNIGTNLYKAYKACNPQIHATSVFTNHFEHQLYIFINIAHIVLVTSEIMCNHFFSINLSFGDLDLRQKLDESVEQAINIYDWIQKDEKNLKKTNGAFLKRVICANKMKKNV